MSYSNDLFITKRRLREWGDWCYQVTTMGLKYSHRSFVAKLQDEGSVMIHGTTKMLAPTNPQAEEVNDLIEEMGQQTPQGAKWANIIRVHYTMQDKEIEKRIKSANLPKTTYFRYLRGAEEWLSQYLTFH